MFRAISLMVVCLCVAAGNIANGDEKLGAETKKEELSYFVVNSPEWLRLSSVVGHLSPHGGNTSHCVEFYTDPYRAYLASKPASFGDYFEWVLPYQGLPGIKYVGSTMLGATKVGKINSVKNINYLGIQKAVKMVHRKGNWFVPHVPAGPWWEETSTLETPAEGGLELVLRLLKLDPPPDGFNFDAWLDSEVDMATVRSTAEKVLPGGKFIIYGECGFKDQTDFREDNTFYMHLNVNIHKRAFEEDLHGLHYLWPGPNGLGDHVKGGGWAEKHILLATWDCLFWGGATPYLGLSPTYGFLPYERAGQFTSWRPYLRMSQQDHEVAYDRACQFLNILKTSRQHLDLLGLVKAPQNLPASDLSQKGYAVNLFDGEAPCYFRTADGPDGDKRLYMFNTAPSTAHISDPHYYDNMPLSARMPGVPAQGPGGDIFSADYQEGFHWVSTGINDTWRTPVKREGKKVVVSVKERLAAFGHFPAPEETLYIVRYKNILSIGRSGESGLHIRVNKTYKENLLVEVRLKTGIKEGIKVVTRPVVNQELKIDLSDCFGLETLKPDNELRVKLYREHVLDDWHIIHFLCDEVIVSGAEEQVWVKLTDLPQSPFKKGQEIKFKAQVGNGSNNAKNLQVRWVLPKGWVLKKGELNSRQEVKGKSSATLAIRALAGEGAAFGGQEIQVIAESGESAGEVAINQGADSKLILVEGGEYWQNKSNRRLVSVSTDEMVDMNGVTIPIEVSLGKDFSAGVLKVIEYNAVGRIVDEEIESQVNRKQKGKTILIWSVLGNDKPYRNFYIYSLKSQKAAPTTQTLEIARKLTVVPGERLVSKNKYKYCTLEMCMKFNKSASSEKDSWIGWMDIPKQGWCYDSFKPDQAGNLSVWNFRRSPMEGPSSGAEDILRAMFDNESGMVEVSSGKKLKIQCFIKSSEVGNCPHPEITQDFVRSAETKGYGVIDCDKEWGDFLWPYRNSKIDRFDIYQYHVYRIEWHRFVQRWYIDNELVYERWLALNDPLPLMVWNESKGNIDIEWIQVTSPYVGEISSK